MISAIILIGVFPQFLQYRFLYTRYSTLAPHPSAHSASTPLHHTIKTPAFLYSSVWVVAHIGHLPIDGSSLVTVSLMHITMTHSRRPPAGIDFHKSCGFSSSVFPFHRFANTSSLYYLTMVQLSAKGFEVPIVIVIWHKLQSVTSRKNSPATLPAWTHCTYRNLLTLWTLSACNYMYIVSLWRDPG